MKKILSFLGVIAAIIIGLVVYNNFLANVKLGESTPMLVNTINSLTNYSTTTGSYCAGCPVRVLPKVTSRQFAYISTDSVAPIYLFFPDGRLNLNFKNTSTGATSESFVYHYSGSDAYYDNIATATITSLNDGLKFVATTSPFIIDLSNQINGEIWATSTPEAGAQRIRVIYSQ